MLKIANRYLIRHYDKKDIILEWSDARPNRKIDVLDLLELLEWASDPFKTPRIFKAKVTLPTEELVLLLAEGQRHGKCLLSDEAFEDFLERILKYDEAWDIEEATIKGVSKKYSKTVALKLENDE